jgi:hypothetical protein
MIELLIEGQDNKKLFNPESAQELLNPLPVL